MKLVKVGTFWINPDRVNAVIDDVNTEGVVFIDIGSKDIYYSIPNRTVDEVVALLEGGDPLGPDGERWDPRNDHYGYLKHRCRVCSGEFNNYTDLHDHKCPRKDNEASDG